MLVVEVPDEPLAEILLVVLKVGPAAVMADGLELWRRAVFEGTRMSELERADHIFHPRGPGKAEFRYIH